MTIYISQSNVKTGNIPSFNTLAGVGEYTGATPKTASRKCVGTCNVNCQGCYAKRMTRYPAVYEHYLSNTLAVVESRFGEIKESVNEFIKKHNPTHFRIHDSGDFYSKDYLEMWLEIANENPSVTFYTYTKRTDLLRECGYDTAEKLQQRADNFLVNLSYWPGVCEDMLEGYQQFNYDMTKEAKGVHCPAVDKNGKKTEVHCSQCKRCMSRNNGKITFVYPH